MGGEYCTGTGATWPATLPAGKAHHTGRKLISHIHAYIQYLKNIRTNIKYIYTVKYIHTYIHS